MRPHRLIAGMVMAMPLLTGACAQRFDTTRLGVPVTMASESATPPAGARFSVTTRSVWALWGMLPVKEPSLEDALAGQVGLGTGVADLTITTRQKLSDVLISVFTLGLIVPRAVTYEGVVVGAPDTPAP